MVAGMLEQARVDAAILSLVKPLVETHKILATKDLNDDLADLLEGPPRQLLVRTDYLEPFCEEQPLSHTQLNHSRVSPSRSVGTVSPTGDLELTLSEVVQKKHLLSWLIIPFILAKKLNIRNLIRY